MIEVCEKAKDRVDKLEEQEKYLAACYRHLVCPKCGSDIEKKNSWAPNCYLKQTYKCTECDWAFERNS